MWLREGVAPVVTLAGTLEAAVRPLPAVTPHGKSGRDTAPVLAAADRCLERVFDRPHTCCTHARTCNAHAHATRRNYAHTRTRA